MNTLLRKYWRDWYFLAFAFLLALVVRVVFVLQWQETPYGAAPLLDARAYDDWAMEIASGNWVRHTAFYQSPLYPYVLGLFYKCFGHDLEGAGLLNAFFGACTVTFLSALTYRLFGLTAAIMTAALSIFYQPFIFYTAPIMKEPLGLCLLSLSVLLSLAALQYHQGRRYFWSGLTFGLAVLVRGNLLLLLPVMPLIIYLQHRTDFARQSLIYIFAVFLAISPATLHNLYVAGEFIPVSYADGFNFYIGHFPGANGTNAYPPEVSTDPTQEEVTTRYVAEQALGGPLSPQQVSHFWRARAVDFMLHNPMQEMTLFLNKIASFWNNAQPFDNYDIDFIAKNFGTLIAHPLVPFWIIAVLAVFSAMAFLRARRLDVFEAKRPSVIALIAWTCAYMTAVILFYVTDRYRLPVVIFLLPLAGAAAPVLQSLLHYKLWKVLTVACAASFVMLLLTLRPPLNPVDLTAFDWGTLAAVYADQGKDQETLMALEQGVTVAPDQIGAQAFVRGAVAEDHLGNPASAQKWLEMAVTLYPNDGIAWYNIGRMRAARGELSSALQSFLKAKELTPTYTLTYYALARVYDKQGQREDALHALHQGLLINPYDARLLDLKQNLEASH